MHAGALRLVFSNLSIIPLNIHQSHRLRVRYIIVTSHASDSLQYACCFMSRAHSLLRPDRDLFLGRARTLAHGWIDRRTPFPTEPLCDDSSACPWQSDRDHPPGFAFDHGAAA